MKKIDISRLEQLRKINLKVGYVIALSLMLVAFSWTTERPPVDDPFDDLPMDDILVIPPTHQEKVEVLPPPPVKCKKLKIENMLIIESNKPELLSTEIAPTEPTPVLTETFSEPAPAPKPILPPPPAPKNKVKNELFKIVEHMPLFNGCDDVTLSKEEKKKCTDQNLLSFLYKNISYPAIARENGVSGMVVVQFVVEKDGSISNAKVIRDIGAGCGEEAVRVVNKMPLWTPGRQRTENVRVQYNLPVKFALE